MAEATTLAAAQLGSERRVAEVGEQVLTQDIRFCTALDGVRIAYALSGQGPPLVFPATWQTHLELDVELLGYKHWLEGLSKHHSLFRGDLRGSGLSDWTVPSMDFEDWVNDLEAIVDDAGLDRFPLFGLSHGTATAIAYAARHPERVSHLVLYAASAGAYFDKIHPEKGPARLEAFFAFMEAFWDAEIPRVQTFFTSDVVRAASPEIVAALDYVRRKSTSPENAVRAARTIIRTDVSDLLAQIAVPTLVLQPSRGSDVTLADAREVAARIPNARLVVLEADNHLMQEYEPGWPILLDETWRFLGVDLAAHSADEHEGSHNGAAAVSARGQEALAQTVPSRSGSEGLSTRELDVLRLLASGKTNTQIAYALTLTNATVATHVRHILDKTRSANRAEASSYAVRNGLA